MPSLFAPSYLIVLVFYFFSLPIQSQNLVQNGSFEEIKTCHDDKWKAYNIDSPRNFMPEWRCPNGCTPDPYGPPCINKNSCPPHLSYGGPCVPHSGDAVVGFCLITGGDIDTKSSGRREYIQTKLTTPLKKNFEYCISFYIHHAIFSALKANAIEAVVSKKKSFGARNFEPIYTSPTIRDTTISDIVGWHHVYGTFIAQGGEQYLTIGNFSEMGTLVIYPNPPLSKKQEKEQTGGAYYYFDDVSLVEMKPGCPCDHPKREVLSSIPEDSAQKSTTKPIILDGVLFESKSALLQDKEIDQLDSLAKWLSENPEQSILIIGHTDNRGKDELNLQLSLDRAITVQHYLIEKGIKQERISCLGKGPFEPISDNETDQGRALNRRVEIHFVQE